MRIGIDCRSLQEQQPSGVSVYALQLLRAILSDPAASQHSFVLFFNGWSVSEEALKKKVLENLPQSVEAPSIEWRFSRVPSKVWTLCSVLGISLFARPQFADCDVVWFPNADFFPLAALKKADGTAIPYVVTLHDFAFIRFSGMQSVKERWRHWILQPERIARNAAHILTVSIQTRDDAARLLRIPKQSITSVYPSIDHVVQSRLELFSKPHTGNVIEFENGESIDLKAQPLIVCVATLEPRKNAEALIEAFTAIQHRYPNATLVFVGKFGAQSTDIAYTTNPQCVWAGYVTDEQKWKLLQHAALCVYPSVYEGFGFPPLEAQVYGIPVIAGAHSALPEVLGNSVLQCDTMDVRSIRNAIETALADTTLRKSLVQRGNKNIERFAVGRASSAVLTVLNVAAQQ